MSSLKNCKSFFKKEQWDLTASRREKWCVKKYNFINAIYKILTEYKNLFKKFPSLTKYFISYFIEFDYQIYALYTKKKADVQHNYVTVNTF